MIAAPGGVEALVERDVPLPEPGPSQVRVRVHAAGVNRADVLQRQGRYPAPPGAPSDIPGLEYAGTVEAVGEAVRLWRPGDRLMGLVGGGAYAQAVVVHEREALRIPPALSFDEAASMPEAYITAYDALFGRLRLALGERLLVHAVGSGVGIAALQLATAAGATVYGTSRSAWKLERATAHGLELGVDTTHDDFADAILQATDGAGVDATLDLVGGPYLASNLRTLAPRGRQVVVGLVAGRTAEVDLGLLLRKRLTLVGTALRGRPLEEKIEATRSFGRHALPLLASGGIRPVIDRIYPVQDAAEAHLRMEANENFGKIVLAWEPGMGPTASA